MTAIALTAAAWAFVGVFVIVAGLGGIWIDRAPQTKRRTAVNSPAF